MPVVTTGLHRFSNVTQRSQFGVLQEVVPGATVYVTITSTGLAATIYSDPGMTILIPGALITTDTSGFYEYYIPAAYNVTEQITAPSGLNVTISNIVLNGNGSFLPLSGGTLTGPLLGTSANFSSTVTGSSFIGAGTGLTGTASTLSIGGNAATATNISTSGTANQVWGMNSGGTAQGWQNVASATGVSSFNTRTGAVTLTASDVNAVGAISNNTTGSAAQLQGSTWAIPPAIGSTTPAAITGTTVASTSQFSGPGTGLTGTAGSLNIGGNAATASNANQLLSKTWAIPAALGSTTPAAVTGTTVTATSQFSGPGTGLTGTAAGLSIGGNAANGVLVGSLTTTASATDTVTITGVTASSHVSLTATNAAAAGMIASTYVSSKSANTLVITHTASSGATFDIIATAN